MAPPPPPPSYAGRAEDTTALLRASITGKEAEQKRLLAEVETLRKYVEGLAKAGGSASSPTYEGCSELVAGAEGPSDTERFLMLSSFPRPSPVAGIAVSSKEGGEVVVAASWDGRAQFFDLARWCECGELDVNAAADGRPSGSSSKKGASANKGHRNKIGGSDDPTALVDAACWRRDPQIVGVASGRDVQLWRQSERKVTRQAAMRHSAMVARLNFHENIGMVGSISDDGAATLWDIADGSSLRKWELGTRPTCLRFAGGADKYQYSLVTGGLGGSVRVWDIRTPSQTHSLPEPSSSICVACHASSHLLAAGCLGGEVSTWDMRTWRALKTVSLRGQFGPRASPRSMAVSPCGSFLAAGCVDGELVIFDIQRQYRAFKVQHHGDAVNALAWGGPVSWARTRHFLAAASLDGTWSCWTHGGRACQEEH